MRVAPLCLRSGRVLISWTVGRLADKPAPNPANATGGRVSQVFTCETPRRSPGVLHVPCFMGWCRQLDI